MARARARRRAADAVQRARASARREAPRRAARHGTSRHGSPTAPRPHRRTPRASTRASAPAGGTLDTSASRAATHTARTPLLKVAAHRGISRIRGCPAARSLRTATGTAAPRAPAAHASLCTTIRPSADLRLRYHISYGFDRDFVTRLGTRGGAHWQLYSLFSAYQKRSETPRVDRAHYVRYHPVPADVDDINGNAHEPGVDAAARLQD